MTDRLTLVLETSTPRASVALVEGDGRIAARDFSSDRSHNARLFGPLEELLAGRDAREIGLVLAGSGPGSYSGIRVGIAAAQGVALAAGCAVVAVPSILALPSAADGAACVAIGDARRGSFWTAAVAQGEAPVLADAAGLAEIVRNAVAAGHAVVCLEDPARFPLVPELLAVVRRETPDAVRLWRAWQAATDAARAALASEPPQPIYLKPPHITPPKRPWLTGGGATP